MTKLSWHEEEVPKDLQINQVYGVLFSNDKRILLMKKMLNGKPFFSLSGGTPEVFDENLVATLKRELLEEINTTIDKPIYLGYQKVDLENGEKPFAQVRMVAKILKIGKRQPDPDSGITYERLLIPPKDAGKTLNWGDIGSRIIELATITAKENFEFEKANENQEYI